MTNIDLDFVLTYLDEPHIALGKEGRGNVEMDETIEHLIAQVRALKEEERTNMTCLHANRFIVGTRRTGTIGQSFVWECCRCGKRRTHFQVSPEAIDPDVLTASTTYHHDGILRR